MRREMAVVGEGATNRYVHRLRSLPGGRFVGVKLVLAHLPKRAVYVLPVVPLLLLGERRTSSASEHDSAFMEHT